MSSPDEPRADLPETAERARPAETPEPAEPARRRPLIERLGMVAIALVLAALFGVVAVASVQGGEPFLGAMGAIGALMTLWVAGLTLVRG